MTFAPFQRVVLTTDVPEDRLQTGDVGVVVEYYRPRGDAPEGYEVEFFSATGETMAVVSLPATSLRAAGATEVLSVRGLARA